MKSLSNNGGVANIRRIQPHSKDIASLFYYSPRYAGWDLAFPTLIAAAMEKTWQHGKGIFGSISKLYLTWNLSEEKNLIFRKSFLLVKWPVLKHFFACNLMPSKHLMPQWAVVVAQRQSGCFWHQRYEDWVWTFFNLSYWTFLFCQLCWNYENKEKEAGNGQFKNILNASRSCPSQLKH